MNDEPLFLLCVGPDGASATLVRGHEALAAMVRDAMWFGLEPESDLPEDVAEMVAIARDPTHERWTDDGHSDAPSLSWSFEDGYLQIHQVTHDHT